MSVQVPWSGAVEVCERADSNYRPSYTLAEQLRNHNRTVEVPLGC